ncbi:MAG: PaaI family thioesterase [Gemmatimonadota bacterium]|nr:PaaI family thioesterase [Gemmatimonadota bacterium]
MNIADIEELFSDSPVFQALRLDVTEMDEHAGRAIVRMPIGSAVERVTSEGMVHGGPIATLIDIAGDLAIAARVGGGVPTINLRVDYLRPGTGTFLEARAAVRRLGRTIATADIDVYDDQDRLCAIGRGTYSSVVG